MKFALQSISSLGAVLLGFLLLANVGISSAGKSEFESLLNELLGEGQVKTGKTVLEQAAQKTQQQEAFLAAAQDEERMRSQKLKHSR